MTGSFCCLVQVNANTGLTVYVIKDSARLMVTLPNTAQTEVSKLSIVKPSWRLTKAISDMSYTLASKRTYL